MGQPRVLLAHYNPKQAESLGDALRAEGYMVHVCSDGKSALSSFTEIQPDLVVLEAMIPGKNGFEVCRELKSLPEASSVPVVITSGIHRGSRYRTDAMSSYGCQEFLERGFSAKDLVTTVRQLLPGAFLSGPVPTRVPPGGGEVPATPVTGGRAVDAGMQATGTQPRTSGEKAEETPAATSLLESLQVSGEEPREPIQMDEGEISTILETLFPEQDSGDLAAMLAANPPLAERLAGREGAAPVDPQTPAMPTVDEEAAPERPYESFASQPDRGPASTLAHDAELLKVEEPADRLAYGEIDADTLSELNESMGGLPAASFEESDTRFLNAIDHWELAGSEARSEATAETATETMEPTTSAPLESANLDPRTHEELSGSSTTPADVLSFADDPVSASLDPEVDARVDSFPELTRLETGGRRTPYVLGALAAAALVVTGLWLALTSGSGESPSRQAALVTPSIGGQVAGETGWQPQEEEEESPLDIPPADDTGQEIDGPVVVLEGGQPVAAGPRGAAGHSTPAVAAIDVSAGGTPRPPSSPIDKETVSGAATAAKTFVPKQNPVTENPTAEPTAGTPSGSAETRANDPVSPQPPGTAMKTASPSVPVPTTSGLEPAPVEVIRPEAEPLESPSVQPVKPDTTPVKQELESTSTRDVQRVPEDTVDRADKAPSGNLTPATPAVVPSLLPRPAGGRGAGQVFSAGDVDEPPRISSRLSPDYPAAARALRLEGDVDLNLLVLESGEVGEVMVLQGAHPILAKAAVEAVKEWRYLPGRKGGRPIRTWTTEKVSFRLK